MIFEKQHSKRIVDRESHQDYINELTGSLELLHIIALESNNAGDSVNLTNAIDTQSSVNEAEHTVINDADVSETADPSVSEKETPSEITKPDINMSAQNTVDKVKPVFKNIQPVTIDDTGTEEEQPAVKKTVQRKKKTKRKFRPWVKYVPVASSAIALFILYTATQGAAFTEASAQTASVNEVIQYTKTASADIDTEKEDIVSTDVESEESVEGDRGRQAFAAGMPSDVAERIKKDTAVNSDAEPEENAENEEESDVVKRPEPLGTRGRLYFDNGWSVALNYADSYNTEEMQQMADAYDSACYMEDSGKVMIADHASQGFEIIKEYDVGSKATIVDENDQEHEIVCTAFYSDAYWEDGFTHLPDGRGIWGSTEGTIGLQTANNKEGTSITISYWNYTD